MEKSYHFFKVITLGQKEIVTVFLVIAQNTQETLSLLTVFSLIIMGKRYH
jgi:hypothetical protein